MAITAHEAFGRYLRLLREDRGLALRRVCELSTESVIPFDKATLSRCEHGRQGPTLSLLVPLSRIYDVPSAALIERFELDAELERAGMPETEGKDYGQLSEAGRQALQLAGLKWHAYGYYREALARAETDPPVPGQSEAVRRSEARLNLATAARSLGKNSYALFEYTELAARPDLPPELLGLTLDRIANCHRCLGRFDLAERFTDDAIREARQRNAPAALAYATFSKASNALDRDEYRPGIEELKVAFRLDRQSGESPRIRPNPAFGVNTLLKLADAYYRIGAEDKAALSAFTARNLAVRSGVLSGEAYSELILGLVDERRGKTDQAVRRWQRVTRMADRMRNHRLRFAAEFFVFRQATSLGNRALADASRRRLERLAPWVPAFLPELREFKSMIGSNNMGFPQGMTGTV